ncbi:MAG: rhomboid family intramembrane serine protease [Planctomycetota bacterium]|jgi:hypothetical protein
MSLLGKAEKKLRRFALPNVTLYLIGGQVLVYLLSRARPGQIANLALVPSYVMAGQFWRLFTFLFVPPVTNPIFAFFAWYLFFLMGTALERQWGVFRYNVYLLIAYVATAGASFATPDMPATNMFIGGSVFLAFAYLYPNFQLLLLFFIPVKVKYLAIAACLGYLFQLGVGPWSARAATLASVANFLLFFGRDIIQHLKDRHWHIRRQAKIRAAENEVRHRCRVCGVTGEDDRDVEFRYCPQCQPTTCYCLEHIFNHEHVGKKRKKAKV